MQADLHGLFLLCKNIQSLLFFPVKTIRTNFTGFYPDGLKQIIQSMEPKGGKVLLLSDILYHLRIFTGAWICVLIENLLGTFFTFSFLYHLSRNQLHL